MIFLIKFFTILNCQDCKKYQQVLQKYCDRTPTELQIIDVDNYDNIKTVLAAKIKGIPYCIFYDVHGSIMFELEGIQSTEEFDMFIYNNRHH